MRKTRFAKGEFYHIYNRGTDKRPIFMDPEDFDRFITSMIEFNALDPIGSLYLNSFEKSLRRRTSKLVNIICYCLNPNHFHMLLEEVAEGGISEFMKRMGGYTKYFNSKYKRNGVLFQGKFKASHVDTNEYLLHVSVYVNLNNRVHKLRNAFFRSSWEEYGEPIKKPVCKKSVILNQFKNFKEYKNFAEDSLPEIIKRKQSLKEVEKMLFE